MSSDNEDLRLAQDEVPEPGDVPKSSNDSNANGTPEERLLLVQRRLIVATLSVCLFFGILYLASIFADILRIFGISILISYLFINVVDWLTRYIKNRAVSIFIVYAVCGVIVTVAFLTVVPSLVYQINLLLVSTVKQVPELFERFCHALIPIDERLASAKIQLRAIDMLSRFAQSLPSMDSAHVIGRMSEVAMSTMTWVLYGLSIMVLSFYFYCTDIACAIKS
ncbi:MAG: AI-2E family transporter [Candidatus Obscuribacter sp.]|nr:AI-2E family transporter [Candidatus Obscuribacter sp.]